MNKRSLLMSLVILVTVHCTNPDTNLQALDILKKVSSCEDFWVKLHAIEYLAELGYTKEASFFIEKELTGYDSIPQKRIGVWRAKYHAAQTEHDRSILLNRIRHAYLDMNGPDRIHAAETLSKLGYSLRQLDKAIVSTDMKAEGMLASFVHWGYALPVSAGDSTDTGLLLDRLKIGQEEARKLAAYALGFIGRMDAENWDTLAYYSLKEPEGTEAHAYFLGAAYSLYDYNPDREKEIIHSIRSRLLELEQSQKKSDRIELCRALAVHANYKDRIVLNRLMQLQHPIVSIPGYSVQKDIKKHPWNLDVQAAAAYALLKQEQSFSNIKKEMLNEKNQANSH